MKKILILIIILFSNINLCFAEHVEKVELSKDAYYLLLLDSDAEFFKISNPNVLSFQLVTNMNNSKDQVMLTATNFGSTFFEVKTGSSVYKYNFKIVKNGKTKSDTLMDVAIPSEEFSK